jgi:uncharacterized protein YcbX
MTGIHPLGTVADLWRYPIKSLLAESLARIDIEAGGIVGDRRRAMFVASPGHARSGRTYRGKENALLHTVATVERAAALADSSDVAVSARDEGPYFDAEPISLVVDAWLAALETLVGMRLDPQRFRPNVFVRAAPDFAADEAMLVGRTIAAGSARFEVVSTIERCVTTTYDVATGEATPLVLRVLAQQRANVMGIYCRPSVPGRVELGDALTLT